MATETQERSAAAARDVLARKRDVAERSLALMKRLLQAVNIAGPSIETSRCLACKEKNRHLARHACPCVCHEVRSAVSAVC